MKIREILRWALPGVLTSLAACSSSSTDDLDAVTQPGHLAGVQIVSGNHQTATAGAELPEPLVGRAIDAAGNSLANRTVTFVVASGGGSLSAGSVTSDSHGSFSGRWTLGPGAGTQKVDVRSADSAGATIYATFESIATAGAATSARAIAGTQSQAAQVSTAVPTPIGVSVVDLNGNAKAGVTVTFTPCETCGSANPASAVTNAGGVAMSTWTLGKSTGTQRLSAALAGLPEVPFDALATPAAPAVTLSLTALAGDGQTVEQHALNAQPLRVFVSDAQGAGVPGVAVDFEPDVGGAYFDARTINTDAEGFADFTGYFHEAGAARVEAAVAKIPSVAFDLAVAATPFEFDGDYTCRIATAPDAPYALRVRRNSVIGSGSDYSVNADGTFAMKRETDDIGRALLGRFAVSFDGSATAGGTATDSAVPAAWTCERL
jgi:hypothetical protein